MEITYYVRAFAALLFVMALIGLMALVLKKYRERHPWYGNKGATTQLSIQEVLPVDAKRKVIRIRSGEKEHVLLVGGNNDLLIDSTTMSEHHA